MLGGSASGIEVHPLRRLESHHIALAAGPAYLTKAGPAKLGLKPMKR